MARKMHMQTRLKDLGLASVCKALKFPLESVDQGYENGRHHYVFVFTDTESQTVNEVLEKYWLNNCLVDAKSLVEAQRDLKTLINQLRQNQ